jgi:hypothetical protein
VSRWKAAAIHLTLSAAIITLVAGGLIWLWYGWTFFERMGGMNLLLLLAGIDVVIGPLLTLVVFKSGKPSLKFDLSVIALLQAGFLAYGLYVMAQSRPVFLVGLVDRFELVFANQLDPADLAEGSAEKYRSLSWSGPVSVGGRMGRTSAERLNLVNAGLAGKDIHLIPRQYTEYSEVQAKLLMHAEPAETLAATSSQARDRIERFAANLGRPLTELVTLPIVSARGRATMILDAETGEILGPVAVEPWADLADKPQ